MNVYYYIYGSKALTIFGKGVIMVQKEKDYVRRKESNERMCGLDTRLF